MQLSKTTSDFRPRTKRRCPTLHQLEYNIFSAIKAALTYIFTGRGLFSSPFQSVTSLIPTRLLDVVALDLSALDASIPANRPDIELMSIANSCTDAETPARGLFTFLPTLIPPKSQGHVRLAANNLRARPDIEPGKFFTEPADDSDSVVDTFIRKNLRDCFHCTSTCCKGTEARGPRRSVVNTALRARVCDTSMFPELVAMHTMTPAAVMAEKCTVLMRRNAAML